MEITAARSMALVPYISNYPAQALQAVCIVQNWWLQCVYGRIEVSDFLLISSRCTSSPDNLDCGNGLHSQESGAIGLKELWDNYGIVGYLSVPFYWAAILCSILSGHLFLW